jgi:hypothetical protein
MSAADAQLSAKFPRHETGTKRHKITQPQSMTATFAERISEIVGRQYFERAGCGRADAALPGQDK